MAVLPAASVTEQKAPPPAEVGIAIAGGGLGGLALAVGLLERGFDVHVFEAAQELRTGSGTIIGITANGKCLVSMFSVLQKWAYGCNLSGIEYVLLWVLLSHAP